MTDPLLFGLSLLFLLGVLMVAVSAFGGVRVRYPKVMLHGFLVSVLSLALVLVVGIVR
jgi:hypothetical protein